MNTIPIKNPGGLANFQGTCHRKPWQYSITAAIPCLDHADETALCVELLRLQTMRPYIMLVDTGSDPNEFLKLSDLRAEDLELHTIRSNGTPHPCDIIAAALDLCFSLADTPYMYTTHQDVFLRSRYFLEYLYDNMPGLAVLGYRLSPRNNIQWEKMFGHTATMFDMSKWDEIGATWTLRRAARQQGCSHTMPPPGELWYIDTEHAANCTIIASGHKIGFCGTEENLQRTVDDNIDHCRSLVCTSLYAPDYHAKAMVWTKAAKREARERIKTWRTYGPAETTPGDLVVREDPAPPVTASNEHLANRL